MLYLHRGANGGLGFSHVVTCLKLSRVRRWGKEDIWRRKLCSSHANDHSRALGPWLTRGNGMVNDIGRGSIHLRVAQV